MGELCDFKQAACNNRAAIGEDMEYEKICDEILGCDEKIRYVGVYDYGELYDKMRQGLKNHLSRAETELSLSQAVLQVVYT